MDPRPILLVDSHTESREIYRLILQHAGYRVIEACSGEEGVRLASREDPCLIFIELTLPILDGIQTLKLLKSQPETSRIPVVVLSAWDEEGDREESRKEGCAAYLSKPCPPRRILEEVSRLAVSEQRRLPHTLETSTMASTGTRLSGSWRSPQMQVLWEGLDLVGD